MLNLLFSDPIVFVFLALALLVAITVHEFAHAFAADRLGDPTPRVQGRLTLNPLPHLDPVGTILLFLAGFGWGKPVQFDPYNLENPRRDAAVISFAGPLSNIFLALVLSLILKISFDNNINPYLANTILAPFVYLNVLLAIFNLLPIHPLDGGKILIWLLPRHLQNEWDQIMRQYGIYILLVLVLPLFEGRSIVSSLISPTINLILNFLLPGPRLI